MESKSSTCSLISVYNSGSLKIYDGTYKNTGGYWGGIACIFYFGKELEIYGGKIEAIATGNFDSMGIDFRNNNDLKIYGGEIIGSNQDESIDKCYGVHSTSNYKGNIYLGTKDANVSIQSPYIKGKTNGIVNPNGKIYFYDGIVIGKTPISNLNIADKEEYYDVIVRDNDEGLKEALLQSAEPEARIVETNTEYPTLKQAIEACTEADTEYNIEILKNISFVETDKIPIDENKNIKIDLNGKQLILSGENTIENSGTLEIYDSSENNSAIITSAKQFIKNIGNLKLDKIVANMNVSSGSSYNYLIYSEGNLNITNSQITLNAKYTGAIHNKGMLDIESSNILGNAGYNEGIFNDGGTGVKVNATISLEHASSTAIYNKNDGIVDVLGGYYIGKENTIYNTGGTVNILDGEIKGGNGVYNKEGKVFIKGGKITERISNSSNAEISISGGLIENARISNSGILNISDTATISSNTGMYYQSLGYVLIENESTGKIEMTGGSINLVTEYSLCGIYNRNADEDSIKIEGGTINVSYPEGKNYTAYGIYNYNNGKITVGKNDGTVNKESPYIYANDFAIYSPEKEIDFYDGKLVAKEAIDYLVENEETGYDVKIEIDENGKEVATLESLDNITEATIVETGENYKSLREAIMACGTEKRTIKLLKHIYVDSQEETLINVKEGQDITIDLNGYYIRNSNDKLIENYGELYLTDSTENKGTIRVKKSVAFNYGKLTLEVYGIYSHTEGTVDEYNKMIYNEGELIVNNSKIDIARAYTTMIHNKGKLQINSLETYSPRNNITAILNDGAKNVEINANIELTWWSQYGSAKYECINNINGGEVIITGGNYYNGHDRAIKNTEGIVTIKAGTIDGYSTAVENVQGKMEIVGGTFLADIGNNGQSESDIIEFTGGTVQYAGIFNNNGGKIIVSGNTVIQGLGNISTNERYAIRNKVGKLEITGGTINITNVQGNTTYGCDMYAIYNESADEEAVKITGGTINVDYVGNNPERTGYGIYNKNTGGIIIGEDDLDISLQSPKIDTNRTGVYNPSGTFKFYDGIIIGQESTAIVSEKTIVPEGYRVITEKEDGLEKCTLGLEPTEDIYAKIDGTTYKSLAAAIRACEDGVETKITIVKPIIVENTISIGLNQNIIIDLNGIDITANIDGYIINNSGTLRIIDTYGGGKIENTAGGEIGGTGTLILGDENGNYVPNIVQ